MVPWVSNTRFICNIAYAVPPPAEQFPSGIAAFPWSMLYDSSKSNTKVLTGTIYSFVNVN